MAWELEPYVLPQDHDTNDNGCWEAEASSDEENIIRIRKYSGKDAGRYLASEDGNSTRIRIPRDAKHAQHNTHINPIIILQLLHFWIFFSPYILFYVLFQTGSINMVHM